MSDLAEQIAREHPPQRLPNRGYVMCATCDTTLSLAGYALHIATVTERAARERIAAEIEALPAESGATGEGAWSLGYTSGVSDAARIARGDTDD
jgi:hypothetical protein